MIEHLFSSVTVLPDVAGDELAALSPERLETELCTLAGHLSAAALCRFLLLVAEFDRREGRGSWGIATPCNSGAVL